MLGMVAAAVRVKRGVKATDVVTSRAVEGSWRLARPTQRSVSRSGQAAGGSDPCRSRR